MPLLQAQERLASNLRCLVVVLDAVLCHRLMAARDPVWPRDLLCACLRDGGVHVFNAICLCVRHVVLLSRAESHACSLSECGAEAPRAPARDCLTAKKGCNRCSLPRALWHLHCLACVLPTVACPSEVAPCSLQSHYASWTFRAAQMP